MLTTAQMNTARMAREALGSLDADQLCRVLLDVVACMPREDLPKLRQTLYRADRFIDETERAKAAR